MAAQAVETIVGYAASNPARVGGPLPTHASTTSLVFPPSGEPSAVIMP